MTDITGLAQRNELLIANGQQTADLLRHLADNEIDSDYFAVASECESYGKETDAELSITEFALRAAGYVDALVEALEKAQSRDVIQSAKDYHFDQQADRIAELDAELEREREKSRRVMSRIAELESRTVKLPDDEDGQAYGFGKWANGKLPATAGTMTFAYCEDAWRAAFEVFSSTAGIKVEADSLDADVNDRNQPGMVVAVHIDVGDFVKFRGRVYEVKETDFDDHDVTLWFVCGEVLKCAAGCPIEVVSAPVEDE
ncbi:hypothetical protein BN1007_71178 [Klebsiella variicola]|uniref:hypothetical protein n=1 Tax=Klebsiella variicola TaxID=244366 RepID=UPI00067220D8|nr:hypothetical protein [Klebsiella variicola]CTQ18834.1 hypothetical protein BN1007_71178 [Klebsiella variicola]CTQ25798.1 hypothetical protein BN1200_880038 [Klebsiella variicola]